MPMTYDVPNFLTTDVNAAPEAPDPPSPTFGATVGAAFRQYNTIGSAAFNIYNFSGVDNAPDPTYNAWDEIKGTPYVEHWKDFAASNNTRYTTALKNQIDQENEDKRTLAASGWTGTFTGMGAGIVDPTLLVPIGGEVTAAKSGYSLGKAALRGGVAGGALIGTQETALQATQETRPASESAVNIGGGIILGSLLGAGAHALLTPAEEKVGLSGYNALNDPNVNRVPSMADGGAATARQFSTDDLSVAGSAAEVAAKAWKFNPSLRLNASPSKVVRQVAQQLSENSMYQTIHAEGETLGSAVETAAQSLYRSRMGLAEQKVNDIFAEMKQSGIAMPRADFNTAITEAGINGDIHPSGNEFVNRAAKALRETVIDPYHNEGVTEGTFDPEEKVKFAKSYWPRTYNTRAIEADEGNFKTTVADYVEQSLQRGYEGETKALARKVADLEGARDLNISVDEKVPTPEEELARKAEIDTEIRKLTAEHNARWAERENVGGKPGFREMSLDIADQAFDKVTGRNYGNELTVDPMYATPLERGPFKTRTLPVPDEVLHENGWMEQDALRLANNYARTVGADNELTRAFGDPQMKDQFIALKNDYRELRKAASKERPPAYADELDTLRAQKDAIDSGKGSSGNLDVSNFDAKRLAELEALDAKRISQSGKDIKQLSALERRDKSDLMALRDLQRGTYMMRENNSHYGRTVRALNHFNFIRLLGGVVRASLSDLYRPAMVHGLGRYLNEGIGPLITNMEAVNLGRAEARQLGVAVNRLLHHRVMSFAELADPYARGNAFERFMENTTKWGAKWSGIDLWNDTVEGMSAQMSMNEILSGKISERKAAFLGISPDVMAEIKNQFAVHGETQDTIHLAHTEDWDQTPQGQNALRAFRNAVIKDTNRTIVRPGYGDEPLMMHGPTGRLLLQFKSFTMASHAKVLVAGLQESKARFVSGLVGMTALGIISTVLREWGGGRDRWEKFKQSASNPGYVIGEGLDNGGIFTIPIEVGNDVEKVSRAANFSFNPIKTPLLAAGEVVSPGSSMQGQSTRFKGGGGLDPGILGPTAGLVFNTFPAVAQGAKGLATGRPLTLKQKRAAASLVPFNSYPGFHAALQATTGDSPYLR